MASFMHMGHLARLWAAFVEIYPKLLVGRTLNETRYESSLFFPSRLTRTSPIKTLVSKAHIANELQEKRQSYP